MEKALAVIGMFFGDEGKGSIVDFLTRRHHSKLTVRFNGGCQASHHVVLPDGRWHAFHQWGSGTFAGASTHLSSYHLLDPFALAREARDLETVGIANPWGLLSVDPMATVITPYQQAMNRIRELARGADRHGSCGLGIGETMEDLALGLRLPTALLDQPTLSTAILDAIRVQKLADVAPLRAGLPAQAKELLTLLDDASSPARYARYYSQIRARFLAIPTLDRLASTAGTVIFEGAQGVLLDQYYGFAPHYTWSETTPANVVRICREIGVSADAIQTVGVLRAYATRHGAGPFPTEGRMPLALVHEPHNAPNDWQQGWRTGAFDCTLVDYAVRAVQRMTPNLSLALTHVDRIQRSHPVSRRYAMAPDTLLKDILPTAVPVYTTVHNPTELTRLIQRTVEAPVTLWSNGPTHQQKVIRHGTLLRREKS